MNKLYEYFDPNLKSDMTKMINDIELIQELVKMKGLENNKVYLDWLDELNKLSITN